MYRHKRQPRERTQTALMAFLCDLQNALLKHDEYYLHIGTCAQQRGISRTEIWRYLSALEHLGVLTKRMVKEKQEEGDWHRYIYLRATPQLEAFTCQELSGKIQLALHSKHKGYRRYALAESAEQRLEECYKQARERDVLPSYEFILHHGVPTIYGTTSLVRRACAPMPYTNPTPLS
jgi:hypothetical protein